MEQTGMHSAARVPESWAVLRNVVGDLAIALPSLFEFSENDGDRVVLTDGHLLVTSASGVSWMLPIEKELEREFASMNDVLVLQYRTQDEKDPAGKILPLLRS